jgi:hypothetical protein
MKAKQQLRAIAKLPVMNDRIFVRYVMALHRQHKILNQIAKTVLSTILQKWQEKD